MTQKPMQMKLENFLNRIGRKTPLQRAQREKGGKSAGQDR
jgi:hypothetical protein